MMNSLIYDYVEGAALNNISFNLPERPFFSCEKSSFLIIDSAKMRDVSALENLEPSCQFIVGLGNVFGTAPKFVVEHSKSHVRIACEEEIIVILDFDDLAAAIETPEGRFLYKGGLDQANDAMGFMKAI